MLPWDIVVQTQQAGIACRDKIAPRLSARKHLANTAKVVAATSCQRAEHNMPLMRGRCDYRVACTMTGCLAVHHQQPQQS
jgi:hypothetical protein